ncbi:MAG: hypothetical protein A2V85_08900 [Chloroflexi bacterium RBG_16_72_14]|nr:MAG: hypothetical protein A2V85_08900 [Chloroflexi bacterium RBG_16_72_14]
MGFLRRLLGGGREPAATGGDREPAATGGARDGAAVAPGEPPPADDEAARDRDLLRAEAERLDDDLLQRQLRYADRSWTPPRQGGEARAGEPGEGGDR